MTKKKITRIPWDDNLDVEKADQITQWLETVTVGQALGQTTHFRLTCRPCRLVIFKRISANSYNRWLSVREQKHFASDQHKQNILMRKLAGDDG